ncbi:Carboxypeptidase Y-like protein [Smittium culicis]|nr:Carboxypeptidase Y-like protein [Smittium culicis]
MRVSSLVGCFLGVAGTVSGLDFEMLRQKVLGGVSFGNSLSSKIKKLPDYFNMHSSYADSLSSQGIPNIKKTTAWSKVSKMSELEGYSMRIKKPKLCVGEDETSYSGYLDISDKSHFFFWFFEAKSKKKDAPIILWVNGGPGCSSLLGLFMELGPCRINVSGDGTIPNDFGWNQDAHVVFLDQPTNVGFSYGESRSSSFAAGKDVYAFIQLLYSSFPEYANSKLHVFGESYGGHYVPAIAKAIFDKNNELAAVSNKPSKLRRVPLESIGIGNGLVDPLEQ